MLIDAQMEYYFPQQHMDLGSWMEFLLRKSPESYRHCVRVALLAEKIAPLLELHETEEIMPLVRGCFLHDLGKAMVPNTILHKKEPLNRHEWKIMRLHPELGEDILNQHKYVDRKIVEIVRHHHERFDGKGYPDRLAGEAIPLLARICTVADAFDSMLSDRPYRTRRTLDHARDELRANSGTQFDERIVECFLQLNLSDLYDNRMK